MTLLQLPAPVQRGPVDDAQLVDALVGALERSRRLVATGRVDRWTLPLLLLAAHRAAAEVGPPGHDRLTREVGRLADAATPHLRGTRTRALIASRPALAVRLGLGHAVLTRLGRPDAGFDAVLDLAVQGDDGGHGEWRAARALEARWLRHVRTAGSASDDAAGDDAAGHDAAPETAAAWSVLGRGVDLVGGEPADLAAVSHALLCASDLGRRSLRCGRSPQLLSQELDGALAVALDCDDLGLAALLLAGPAVLREPWSPTQAVAWRVLEAAAPDAPYELGLCTAAILATGWPPPAEPDPVGADPQAEALLDALSVARPRAALAYLATAHVHERAAAVPLLLDISARRAALGGDTPALVRTLEVAAVRGLSSRVMLRQASAALQRLLLPSVAAGSRAAD